MNFLFLFFYPINIHKVLKLQCIPTYKVILELIYFIKNTFLKSKKKMSRLSHCPDIMKKKKLYYKIFFFFFRTTFYNVNVIHTIITN